MNTKAETEDPFGLNINLNGFNLNDLIKQYLRKGDIITSLQLYRDMKKLKIEVDKSTNVNFLETLLKNKNIDQAKQFFNEINKIPEIQYYNSMILGLITANNNIEEGIHYFNEMKSNHLIPDITIYTTLISEYIKRNKTTEANKIYLELKELNTAGKLNYEEQKKHENSNISIENDDNIEMIERKIKNQEQKQDLVSYNVRIEEYFRNNKINSAINTFNEMKTNKIQPNLTTYSIMINELIKKGKPYEGIKYFNEMKSNNIQGENYIYSIIMKAYFKIKDIEGVKKLYLEIQELNIVPDLFTYAIFINGFAKNGYINFSIKIFNEIKNKQNIFPLNIVILNTMIRGYFENNKYNEAIDLFKDMKSEYQIDPDKSTYEEILQVLVHQNKFDELNDLLIEMKDNEIDIDVVTFTKIISQFIQLNKLKKAKLYFEKMMNEYHIKPDKMIYSKLLQVCKENKSDHEYYKNLMEKQNITLDEDLYQIIINLINKNKLTNLHDILNEIKLQNIPLDIILLNKAIYEFLKSKKFNQAIEIYDHMKNNQLISNHNNQIISPNLFTYNFLIIHLIMNKNFDLAKKYFHDMIDIYHIKGNLNIYTSLIINFIKINKINDSLFFFNEMKNQDIRPDIFIYNSLISSLSKLGQFDDAKKLFYEMKNQNIQPDIFIYNSLISCFFKNREIDSVKLLIFEMRSNNLKPDKITFNILIDGFLKNNQLAGAEKIFYDMKNENVKPDIPICNSLLNAFLKNNQFEKANLFFNDLKLKNTVTFNTMMNGLFRAGKVNDALAIYEDMKVNQKSFISILTLNDVIAGLIKNNNFKLASQYYDEIGKLGLKPDDHTQRLNRQLKNNKRN